MQGRGNLIVGLDIGTTKICCVVGEMSQGSVNIIGIGTHPVDRASQGRGGQYRIHGGFH